MADNYLEKKMEDLRMGKTGASAPRRRLTPGAGRICFDFPPRRVLVAGGCHGIGEAIVDAYLHAGCKVAVFDSDRDKGSAMARDKGIRFYPIDCSDHTPSPSRPIQPYPSQSRPIKSHLAPSIPIPPHSAPYSAFANLLKAWRDIDIIIVNAALSDSAPYSSSPISPYSAPFCSILPHLWAEHRHRYPIPTDYPGRFILLLPTEEERFPSVSEFDSSSDPTIDSPSASEFGSLSGSVQQALLAAKDLSPLGITANILRLAPEAANPAADIAPTKADIAPTKNAAYSRIISRILLLSLPSASFISGIDIPAP